MDFQHAYQILFGHIRYLDDSTSPELAYTAAVLGIDLQKQTLRHKDLLHSAIRYIKGTKNLGISYHAGQCTDENIGSITVDFDGQALKAY